MSTQEHKPYIEHNHVVNNLERFNHEIMKL